MMPCTWQQTYLDYWQVTVTHSQPHPLTTTLNAQKACWQLIWGVTSDLAVAGLGAPPGAPGRAATAACAEDSVATTSGSSWGG
jgi:hypothetical protein